MHVVIPPLKRSRVLNSPHSGQHPSLVPRRNLSNSLSRFNFYLKIKFAKQSSRTEGKSSTIIILNYIIIDNLSSKIYFANLIVSARQNIVWLNITRAVVFLKVELKIKVKLTVREARQLLEEAEDIKVGLKPTLHELIDRIEEALESIHG